MLIVLQKIRAPSTHLLLAENCVSDLPQSFGALLDITLSYSLNITGHISGALRVLDPKRRSPNLIRRISVRRYEVYAQRIGPRCDHEARRYDHSSARTFRVGLYQ